MNAPLVNAVETGKNIKRLREEKGITGTSENLWL